MVRYDLALVLLQEVPGCLDDDQRTGPGDSLDQALAARVVKTKSESLNATSAGFCQCSSLVPTSICSAAPGDSGDVGTISGKATAPHFESGSGNGAS